MASIITRIVDTIMTIIMPNTKGMTGRIIMTLMVQVKEATMVVMVDVVIVPVVVFVIVFLVAPPLILWMLVLVKKESVYYAYLTG